MNKWISSLPASKHGLKRLPMEKKRKLICVLKEEWEGDSGQEGEEGMKGTFLPGTFKTLFHLILKGHFNKEALEKYETAL